MTNDQLLSEFTFKKGNCVINFENHAMMRVGNAENGPIEALSN